MNNSFNIRVYGILVNKEKEVLLADEYVLNAYMTKFPGGGLEFGEGTEDCLRREAKEEFGQEITIENHLYTTHFYQEAQFFKNTQLLSIYYTFSFKKAISFQIDEEPFGFKNRKNENLSFRWAPLNELKKEDLTFPIDQYVLTLLKEKYL
jgi:8-oxo-dGTP pyrophosphatase MutT (NUDIX family)